MAQVAPADVDRSTLRLSEVARHIVVPAGIDRSLWLGWDGQLGVEERVRDLGYQFDPWQDGLAQLELGVTAEGRFAATVGGVVLSIPRQVAKTFMTMVIVVALCTMFPNLTVLWTAHRGRLSTQTFGKMKALAQTKALRKHLLPGTEGVRSTNGEQEIRFRNGSRIMFGAREFGFGLGFDEVDIEVFDEAQRLTSNALDDMIAATNQSRWAFGALLFFMGTPPRPTDEGEEFANRRAKALAVKEAARVGDFGGIATGGLAVYVECSADADVGTKDGPDLDDREQVKIANPSYPHRTPEVSIQRLRENLTNDDSWKREGLGVWDPRGQLAPPVIDPGKWQELRVDRAPSGSQVAYGVRFSADGARVALSAALADGDSAFVEVLDFGSPIAAMDGLVAWLAARWRDCDAIVIDGKGAADLLERRLLDAGVRSRKIVRATLGQAGAAYAGLLDRVTSRTISHAGQPGLKASIACSKRRDIGRQGAWGYEPNSPDGESVSTESVALAISGLKTKRAGNGRGTRQSAGRRGTVM